MSKKAEEAALKAYPFIPLPQYDLRDENPTDGNKIHRRIFIEGYEQAEKDIWDRIEKYLKTRHHMDYATVGWILDNIEYYKQKIMED